MGKAKTILQNLENHPSKHLENHPFRLVFKAAEGAETDPALNAFHTHRGSLVQALATWVNFKSISFGLGPGSPPISNRSAQCCGCPHSLHLPDFPPPQKPCPDHLLCSSLWGPLGLPEDRIADGVELPELQDGDWLIFQDMGAYSIAVPSLLGGCPQPQVTYAMSRLAW